MQVWFFFISLICWHLPFAYWDKMLERIGEFIVLPWTFDVKTWLKVWNPPNFTPPTRSCLPLTVSFGQPDRLFLYHQRTCHHRSVRTDVCRIVSRWLWMQHMPYMTCLEHLLNDPPCPVPGRNASHNWNVGWLERPSWRLKFRRMRSSWDFFKKRWWWNKKSDRFWVQLGDVRWCFFWCLVVSKCFFSMSLIGCSSCIDSHVWWFSSWSLFVPPFPFFLMGKMYSEIHNSLENFDVPVTGGEIHLYQSPWVM